MRESTECELRFVVFGGFGIGGLFGQKVKRLKREKRLVCDRVYRTAASPTPLSSSSITIIFSIAFPLFLSKLIREKCKVMGSMI
jgi:hypothetical protein